VFSTIKTYAIAALAVISGILAALWQYQRAKFKSAQLDGVEKAREVEQKDIKATIEGMENENKAVNSDIKPDHFK
jgi:hypothetical protein